MDLITLLHQFAEESGYENIARNPRAQFGRRGRNYLRASLLPERNAPANAYREDGVRVEQHGIADLVKVAAERALAARHAPGQLTIDDV